ncbi:MAG: CHAT domain-containing protein [Spirochaetales bacterium]|nr:CHAT domain-containing protein [Spirochaetales bacterium]
MEIVQMHFQPGIDQSLRLTVMRRSVLLHDLTFSVDFECLRTTANEILMLLDQGQALNSSSPNDQSLVALIDKGKYLQTLLFGRSGQALGFNENILLGIYLPAELTYIPVELCYQENFLCLKHPVVRLRPGESSDCIKHLFTFYGFNPGADPELYRGLEFRCKGIQKRLQKLSRNFQAKHGAVFSKQMFLEKLASRDVVVMTGHCETGRIPFGREDLTRVDLTGLNFSGLSLFVNNSCFSADIVRSELLPVFLASGVRNYLGYLSRVPQDAAHEFVLDFLRGLSAGLTAPVALHDARRNNFRQLPGSLVWANGLLWGSLEARLTRPDHVRKPANWAYIKAASGLCAALALSALIRAFWGGGELAPEATSELAPLHSAATTELAALSAGKRPAEQHRTPPGLARQGARPQPQAAQALSAPPELQALIQQFRAREHPFYDAEDKERVILNILARPENDSLKSKRLRNEMP